MPKRVLIAFGSPSDVPKPLEFERMPDTEYYMSVASAHRTPDIAAEHALEKWDAVVAVAGLCNALKDLYATRSGCPVVAVPMRDSRTDGLSGILSSTEMPPGYPVAATRLNDVTGAVRFVNHAMGAESFRISTDKSEAAARVADDAYKILKELGVSDSGQNPLQLFPYIYGHRFLPELRTPTVCCHSEPIHTNVISRLEYYVQNVADAPNAVHTGVADGTNLGLYAAGIIAMNNGDLRARMEEYRAKGREKYARFKNLVKL